MNTLPSCLLYTEDDGLARRAQAYLRAVTDMEIIDDPRRLEQALSRHDPTLLLADIRVRDTRDILPRIRAKWPSTLLIVLGTHGSTPMREAEVMGVHAVADLASKGRELQGLVGRALHHLELLRENTALHRQAVQTRDTPFIPGPKSTTHAWADLSEAARYHDDLPYLARCVVQGFSRTAECMRAALFLRRAKSSSYRYAAGLHVPDEVSSLTYEPTHPLPSYFETHARVLTATLIDKVATGSETSLLRQTLEEAHSEVIIPLFGAGRMLGWIAASGPFAAPAYTDEQLRNFLDYAAHASALLQNAIQLESKTSHGEQLQTLLDTMTTGIVMTDNEGLITWMNKSAGAMFDLVPAEITGQSIRVLGSQPAGAVRRALKAGTGEETHEWRRKDSGKSFTIQVRSLAGDDAPEGTVALIRDITTQRSLPETPATPVDDQTFWSELAAGMSHEIRNPLVAIRTFAQLLPSRYEDASFREEFTSLVTHEVDKLNRVVDQINAFAEPPELDFKPVDIRSTIKKGLNMALLSQPRQGVKVEIALNDQLPYVQGDGEALARCFTHIFMNAMEAVSEASNPRIQLVAREEHEGEEGRRVHVTVQDNGRGIADELYPRIFSPFCTTKARGLGLGLPIVRRTVTNHRGKLDIATNKKGTRVTVTLPVTKESKG